MEPIVIHSPQSSVKKHPLYESAKAGSAAAAEALVYDCLSQQGTEDIRALCYAKDATLIAVHALEGQGMNAIPRVFGRILSRELDLPLASGVIQANIVAHTGATGYHRLAFPALFEGDATDRCYFMVDDFIGQGGTLANLRGHLERCGASVVGGTALTGRPDSAVLSLTEHSLTGLRRKHGEQLEEWWPDTFGYGLDRLSESEARYLTRVDSFDDIRERLTAARRARNR